ncbi:MAG: MFS transporter [Actinobacteria bacterium]|nr:MAG: MFS transporter [Actinomycetota bacterium]
MLIGARVVQGVYAALLTPAALALLTVTFVDPRERAKAFAVYGAIAGGGMAVGLILGGLLTQYVSWRWTLGINVPLSAVAILMGVKFLRESRAEGERRYDIPGVVMSAIGLGMLVYGFTIAGEEGRGWTAPLTLTLTIGGFLVLVVFVLWERRSSHPLLPMRVFMDRSRGGSYLALVLTAIGLSALFFFLTFYFQGSLGLSPLQTGLAFIPFAIAIVATSTLTASLLPKTGPRPLVVSGSLIAAAGMLMLSRLSVDTHLAFIMGAEVLVGVGVALAVVPLSSTALIGVDDGDAGVASALVNAVQQIGAAMGITLLNAAAASATPVT